MAANQQQAQVSKLLVEEKQYRLDFDEGAPLVRRAIEHALGVKLDELATGMWSASKKVDRYSYLDVTVRALRSDDGMNVEVRLEHRFNARAVTAFTVGVALGCVIILPLIPTIMVAHRIGRKHSQQRLIEMHKVWTEIGEAVGAPRRAGYRERPERAYAPMRVEDEPKGRRVALEDDHFASDEDAEVALGARR
jgi:hypothetical protein